MTDKRTAKERAAHALGMLGCGDKYISFPDRNREYDDCFEAGDGDEVVRLIVRACKLDPMLAAIVRRSRFACLDKWQLFAEKGIQ